MEPRQALNYDRPFCSEWQWLYNQPTISLRGQDDLLVRLRIAEVADMNSLQATVLRWGESIIMREHVEWMSVMWLKNVLKDLEKEGGCLGRRMENFESVEAEVCTYGCNHTFLDGENGIARQFSLEEASIALFTAPVPANFRTCLARLRIFQEGKADPDNPKG